MSEVKRAYDLLRGYVQREWDRISQIEWDEAAKELVRPGQDEATLAPTASGSVAPTADKPEPVQAVTIEEQARRILGVEVGASFSDIRAAYQRLNEKSDSANFPSGSADALIADKLRSRIQWAYQVLSAKADETERRFGSLEID